MTSAAGAQSKGSLSHKLSACPRGVLCKTRSARVSENEYWSKANLEQWNTSWPDKEQDQPRGLCPAEIEYVVLVQCAYHSTCTP